MNSSRVNLSSSGMVTMRSIVFHSLLILCLMFGVSGPVSAQDGLRGGRFDVQRVLRRFARSNHLLVRHDENSSPSGIFAPGSIGLRELPLEYDYYMAWEILLYELVGRLDSSGHPDYVGYSHCGAFIIRERQNGVLVNLYGDDLFMDLTCRSSGQTTPAGCSNSAEKECDENSRFCFSYCSWRQSASNVNPLHYSIAKLPVRRDRPGRGERRRVRRNSR